MLKGYRTLIANVVLLIPLAWDLLVVLMQSPELAQLIPKDYLPIYTAMIPLVNIILRLQTTTAVGRKQ